MYPIIVRSLAELRHGDRLIARSGVRYPRPLRVIAALGPIPGTAHGRGVRVENPIDGDDAEWVIYPWQMDGQVLEIDRPWPTATDRPSSSYLPRL